MDLNSKTVAVGIVASVAVFSLGIGQLLGQQSEHDDRVLHRYLDPQEWLDGDAGDSGIRPNQMDVDRAERPETAPGQRPGLWLSPAADEWIWTPDGPVGPSDIDHPHGDPDVHPGPTELDDQTDQVDELDYQATFRPSVIPFKRAGVQNEIHRTDDGRYLAQLDRGDLEAVPIGGDIAEGGELFWGSFLVRLQPGVPQRIASVAPDQQIVSVDTEPRLELRVLRDDADNYYVASEHAGLVRINMEIGVRRDYFDGRLDNTVGWEDFAARQRLDGGIRRRARQVHQWFGVDPERMTPREALDELVDTHRQFESQPLDLEESGDRYLDISRQRVGVCRHRSLTFMISALGLGFDVRYVYNEAHAFVEINWPGQGWRRIDLGGMADAVESHNLGSATVHDGFDDEEFPRPQNYEEEMGRLDTSPQEEGPVGDLDEPMPRDDESGRMETDDEQDRRTGADVEILEVDGSVYRGESVRVRGRVDTGDAGADIEVVLVPVGAVDVTQGVRLGEATAGVDGRFEGRWQVPEQLSLGRWRVAGQVVE